MSGLLDTSTIVRYLTGDSPELAERAATVIDGENEIQITDVVLAETAYVLVSVYGVPRDVVVDHLVALLRKRNIRPFAMEKETVLHALLMCRPSGRVSFADALLWAAARSSESKVVYTLDKRFPADGVEVRKEL